MCALLRVCVCAFVLLFFFLFFLYFLLLIFIILGVAAMVVVAAAVVVTVVALVVMVVMGVHEKRFGFNGDFLLNPKAVHVRLVSPRVLFL